MDGIAAIRQLMLAESEVTAFADGESIMEGALPQGTVRGYSLSIISTVERNLPSPGATKHVFERVQVTAIARTLDDVADMLAAARKACADKFPIVSGLVNVSVLFDNGGPGGYDAATMLPSRSYDFLVSYRRSTS